MGLSTGKFDAYQRFNIIAGQSAVTTFADR